MTHGLSRQERRKQRTRQRLLDAARRLIALQGYEATGILDITEEADVSKGTFYQYFKDKEDLTRTLIMTGLEELRARVEAMTPPESDPESLRETLRAVFHYAAENRDLFHIMSSRQATGELSLLALNYYTEVAENILRSLLVLSDRPPYSPALLAQFTAGAIVRVGLWWMEDDRGLSPDQITDIVYRLLTEGVFNAMLPGDSPKMPS